VTAVSKYRCINQLQAKSRKAVSLIKVSFLQSW
jgi:hypothetical protein